MIIFCENCGKKYKVDDSKIGPKGARFKCKECHHLFTVESSLSETSEASSTMPEPSSEVSGSLAADGVQTESGSHGFGLRMKMFLLFFFIPMLLIALAGVMYVRQLDNLAHLINKESTNLVSDFFEQITAEKSRAVAVQIKLFLDSHPDMSKEEFNNNISLKQIAVQKIGMTGYTALYERPENDNGIWHTWAHPNPKIIAIDMEKTLKGVLGSKFKPFWQIYSGVKGGKESRGYYTWKDSSGKMREKFMVCTPVPGTAFVVATTTYLDEFARRANQFKARSDKLTNQIKKVVYIILAATLLLVGLTVSIYAQRLTGKIRKLTDLTERISLGELEASVEIKSRDEIGSLAEAISRMQTSIRYSIARLRRR